MTDTRDAASIAAEQAGERIAKNYADHDPEMFPDRTLFELAIQHAALDAVTDASPHIEQAMRLRLAAYLDRAVAGKRQTAAQGLLADTIVADSWAEVASWCRDETIWSGDD